MWSLCFALLLPIGWVAGSYLRMLHVEKHNVRQAAPQTAADSWVQADDVQMHIQSYGSTNSKTLVMTHGTGAWSGTWVSSIDALTQAGWHVIAIDLPPFGFTEHTAQIDYSRAAQARRILALIDTLDLQHVTLLGHSFGGGPAAQAAILDQNTNGAHRIAHLVLVDAAIGLQDPSAAACKPASGIVASALQLRPLRTALTAAFATNPLFSETLLRKFVARKEAVTPERTAIYRQPFTLENFSASLGDWAWHFATACETTASYRPSGYKSLNLAVSLVWGDQDTITPMSQAQDLRNLIPNSRITKLQGVGHIPQIEDVELFNREIIKVLNDVPALQ